MFVMIFGVIENIAQEDPSVKHLQWSVGCRNFGLQVSVERPKATK